jgi:hypothetical protein
MKPSFLMAICCAVAMTVKGILIKRTTNDGVSISQLVHDSAFYASAWCLILGSILYLSKTSLEHCNCKDF